MLGLEPQASPADIARAYRTMLRRHHPDTLQPTASLEEARQHGERLQQAMEAHAVLADPARRARYDRERHWHPVPPPIQEPFGAPFLSVSAPGLRPGGRDSLRVSMLRWDPPTQTGRRI